MRPGEVPGDIFNRDASIISYDNTHTTARTLRRTRCEMTESMNNQTGQDSDHEPWTVAIE